MNQLKLSPQIIIASFMYITTTRYHCYALLLRPIIYSRLIMCLTNVRVMFYYYYYYYYYHYYYQNKHAIHTLRAYKKSVAVICLLAAKANFSQTKTRFHSLKDF